MALHTPAEFSRLTGKSSGYISMYIKRGTLIAQTDKSGQTWIDDSLEVNNKYLKKWQREALLGPKEKPTPKKKTARSKSRPRPKKTPAPKKSKTSSILETDRLTEKDLALDYEVGDLSDDQKFAMTLDQREQILKIRKLEEETEIKRLQKEKLLGLNVPVADVKIIFAQTFTSFAAQFREATEDIAEIMCARLGGDTVALNDIRMQLESVINETVTKSKEDSRKALKAQTEDYSDTRGKGERKT
jgi:dimeric dUTPase (all-alpha-NTP-PPase superfamily)